MQYQWIVLSLLVLVSGLQYSAGSGAAENRLNLNSAHKGQKDLNPHRTPKTCDECHMSTDESHPTLRYKDISSVCDRCHRNLPEHTTHTVDMKVPAQMFQGMNMEFKAAMQRSDDSMSCIVCHDLDSRCDHSDEHRDQRKSGLSCMSLRGKVLLRSDVCYNCHSVDNYQRLNAHKQIDEKGNLIESKCLICHPQVPEQFPDNPVLKDKLHVGLDDNRAELCLNCHQPGNHPADSPRHLGKPSPEIANRMSIMQAKLQLKLPLEPATGRIYCATCHNPHQPGVIIDPQLAIGGDNAKRLRYSDACALCHDK